MSGFGNVVDVKINRKGVTRDLPVCAVSVQLCTICLQCLLSTVLSHSVIR